jgi:hypothetical protein
LPKSAVSPPKIPIYLNFSLSRVNKISAIKTIFLTFDSFAPTVCHSRAGGNPVLKFSASRQACATYIFLLLFGHFWLVNKVAIIKTHF